MTIGRCRPAGMWPGLNCQKQANRVGGASIMESMLGQHPDSLQGPDYVIQDSYPRTQHFCIKPLIEKFNSQASGAQDQIL